MASIFDVFNMMQQGGGTEAGTGNQAMPQMGVYPQQDQGIGMWRNIDPQQMMQMGQGMMQQGQPQQQQSPLPFAGGPVNVGGGAYSQQFNQLQTPMPQGGGYTPQSQSVAQAQQNANRPGMMFGSGAIPVFDEMGIPYDRQQNAFNQRMRGFNFEQPGPWNNYTGSGAFRNQGR